MALPDSHQPFDDLRVEFKVQKVNNRVLGFPQETPPIITPQKARQILAFGTLEALLTNIQRYNDAYTAIHSNRSANDTSSVISSLQSAGDDIKLVSSYLRGVGLLDATWQHSPGVQLLISPDAPLSPLSAAAVATQQARKQREDEQAKAAEEVPRNEAAYEFAARARREKLDRAIYESIRFMMSYYRANRNMNIPGTQTTTVKNAVEAEEEPISTGIPKSSELTTFLNSGCEDEASVPAKGNGKEDITGTTPSKSCDALTFDEDLDPEDAVIEVPNAEYVLNATKTSAKRKAAGAPFGQAKSLSKRSKVVQC